MAGGQQRKAGLKQERKSLASQQGLDVRIPDGLPASPLTPQQEAPLAEPPNLGLQATWPVLSKGASVTSGLEGQVLPPE